MELIGGYNPDKRREEISNNLETFLSSISASKIYSQLIESGKSGATKIKKPSDYDDLYNTSLEGLEKNIAKLQVKVDQFSSPKRHFTKEYRTLIGYCGRYQTDLDKIDVQGNEDMRKRRKDCLMILDNLQDILATRVHPDGMICRNCEITE